MVTKNEKGQSTVEFIMTFAFGVSIIMVIFTSALNHATGFLVQYATYMASRVYLTADAHVGVIGATSVSLNGSVQKAQEAFNAYNLNVFNLKNVDFRINEAGSTDDRTYLTVGASTTFNMTIGALGKISGQQQLDMVSESFLGKEPTRAECGTRVCKAITGTEACDDSYDITLFDNGC